MMKVLQGLFFLCLGLTVVEAHAQPDKACDGTWSIELIKDKNYTPWHSYHQSPRHPVRLKLDSVQPNAITFTDNRGNDCYVNYRNDAESDFVRFNHCFVAEYYVQTPYDYKIRCEGDGLIGKVMSSKEVFKLKGTRVKG